MTGIPSDEASVFVGNDETGPKRRAYVFETRHGSPDEVQVGMSIREVMRFMGQNTIFTPS